MGRVKCTGSGRGLCPSALVIFRSESRRDEPAVLNGEGSGYGSRL